MSANTAPAATAWRTARQLAWLRTLAVTVALVTMAGGAALAYRYSQARDWPWLAGAAAVVVIGATFSMALWRYTSEVQAATWQREHEIGTDIDGDGVIGRPEPPERRARFVPLTANGESVDPLWIWDGPEAQRQAVILDGFDLEAGDVAAFLAEASRRGLAASAWLRPGASRFELPSGSRVTRGVWDRCTAELVRIGWAENATSGLEFQRRLPDMRREIESMA